MSFLSRSVRWLGGFLLCGAAALLVRELGSTPPKDVSSIRGNNPLPPCPNTPNCTRESHLYEDVDPDELFRRLLSAVTAMGAASMDANPEKRTVDATFRVIIFRDDLQAAVTPEAQGSALHVRSASRIAGNDLGVNRRRVKRLLHRLDAARDDEPASETARG